MSKVKVNVTPTNKDNAMPVERMMGKAICAYANLEDITSNRESLVFEYGINAYETRKTELLSELEATERCIAMFVKESLPEIGIIVIGRAKEEFGI